MAPGDDTARQSPGAPDSTEDQGGHGLSDLSRVLDDFIASPSNATFTCGGTIPLADLGPRGQEPPDPASIIIRWDRDDGSLARVRLPVAADPVQEQALGDLVADCQPAGFGHNGKDKYDESVRRARAMDASRFATNLCPYWLGIADRITQILLPNAAAVVGPGGFDTRGIIRVEPYRLNVYQGPSGFFKAHVDTPRGDTHFASLVLCLPSPHKGGQLTVSHAGQDPVAYGWDRGADALQWAAFYSDCEHQVHEVTAGTRVALTYNLYHAGRRPGGDATAPALDAGPAPVDVQSLAPYAKMQALLANPAWMPDGGVLGIYCAHAYATVISRVKDLDPDSWSDLVDEPRAEPPASDRVVVLKGTDMALYAVFAKLGLDVRVKPILDGTKNLPKKHEMFEYPREGDHEPGVVGWTYHVTHDGDDATLILEKFGRHIPRVHWVTKPLYRSLGLIHGNYFGNEVGGPGLGYTYNALLVTIPDAASRQMPPPA